jgi:predicted permease
MAFVVLVVSFFVGIFWLSRKNKKNHQKTEKKWLLKEIIFGYGSITGLMNLPIQIALNVNGENYSDWALLLFSFFIILMALGEYIVLVLIPSKAETFLKETYPEYNFVK